MAARASSPARWEAFLRRPETPVGAAASSGLLALRIGIGLMLLIGHGWPKLMAYKGLATSFPDPLGIGSAPSLILVLLTELAAALMIVLGVYVRLAAIPVVVMMAVAVLFQHASDPWAEKELAMLYLVPALTLALAGGGTFRVDKLWHRR